MNCTQFLPPPLRSGLVLNVRSEKVDSVVVNKVMHEVVSDWTDVTMVDYAVAESSKLPEGKSQDQKQMSPKRSLS